jgi:ethanolaminephosphotransferase
MLLFIACTPALIAAAPQVNRSGGSITYFGDDTWGKAFSPVFSRVDGVTSFDVLDTHAVDFNVTRNTIRELRNARDWRLSIWHFLGVDHAGHVGGIHSESMCVLPLLHNIVALN